MDKKFNVLMVSHHRRKRILIRPHAIARYLVERGYSVTLIVTADSRHTGLVESELNGVRIIEAPDLFKNRMRSGWDLWGALWRVLFLSREKQNYDFVYTFESRPSTIYPALYFCAKHQLPFFIDWIDWFGRGGLITVNRPKWYQYIFGWVETYYEEAYRTRAIGNTVIAHGLAKRAIGLGVPTERIHLLPGGTNPKIYLARDKLVCRRKVGWPIGDPILGFSSSDSHLDLDIVMASLAIVAKEFPSIKLMITGVTNAGLLKMAQSFGVRDNLLLVGYLPLEDYIWHLGCADIFLLPFPCTNYNLGRWPNKMGDYMSLGRPTVSNSWGDIKVLFEKHAVGLLARWEPEDFAKQIIYLLEHPAEAQFLGENARQVAVNEYDWNILIDGLDKFFNQMMVSFASHQLAEIQPAFSEQGQQM